MSNEESGTKFKVVFVGDSTVGKTSIIHNFLKLDMAPTSTLGAISSRIESEVNGTKIIMNVWDTAGQETFRNLVPVYAKGSNAAVIVFDQTKPETFEHVDNWFNYLREHVGNDLITCLVSNKSDLEAQIDFNDVYAWAAQHDVEAIRTSAKDGTNISTLFDTLSQKLYNLKQKNEEAAKQKEAEEAQPTVDINENKKNKHKESKGCCK